MDSGGSTLPLITLELDCCGRSRIPGFLTVLYARASKETKNDHFCYFALYPPANSQEITLRGQNHPSRGWCTAWIPPLAGAGRAQNTSSGNCLLLKVTKVEEGDDSARFITFYALLDAFLQLLGFLRRFSWGSGPFCTFIPDNSCSRGLVWQA